MLFRFPDAAIFAHRLALASGIAPTATASIQVHRFPDGESLVRATHPPATRTVLVRSLDDPNAKLVETLLAADALRRAGARHLTLIAPYLPYMRQDTVFRPGEPVSQRVIGSVLGAAFDRVLTVEAHLHRIRRLADVVQGRSVSAAPAVAEWVRRNAADCLLVGPDEESSTWVRAIARAAGVPWVVGAKERRGDRRVRVRLPPFPPRRSAVLVDDMSSSGVTLAVAAAELRKKGVESIDALVVHAIFAPGAESRIRDAGVGRLISCDTVPHASNRIRCAPLVAAAMGDPGSSTRSREIGVS